MYRALLRVCILIALIANGHAQDDSEKLRLIHAGSLERKEVDGRIIQSLIGDVELRQGDLMILCDRATHDAERQIFTLIGNVKIYDPEQTLLADTVFVFQAENRQIASGNVVNITASDTTTADRMHYYQRTERLFFEGNVRIASAKDPTRLTGDYLHYLRDDKSGTVWGRPRLTNLDSLGNEASHIVADTMKFYDGGERTVAIQNVVMTQPEAQATADTAEYFKAEGRLRLLGSPQVDRRNQVITGDTLELYLDESKLERAIVTGNAQAVSEADTLSPGRWQNKLSGQAMTFLFRDGALQKVVVQEQATSLYHIVEENQYKGANELSGDKIVIELTEDQAERVLVTSNPDVAEGKYLPPN